MIGKRLGKIIQQLLLIFCILKKKKYLQLISKHPAYILYTQLISSLYISKHNSTREKQIILLKIPNEEKEGRWYYLTVRKISALLHRITSKNKSHFDCLNCLHSFRT